ncbi:RNA polymerase sigma factor [Polyangium spumosum]|uniref:RNA polymerase sigma factor n=1 Tax=Polyangium spumosum TaxID=889282 RepID=UPI0014792207|nr:sigma-70 family RNA polymerase sigma factor [Polyangium spumosum]
MLQLRDNIRRFLASQSRKRVQTNEELEDRTQDTLVRIVECSERYDENVSALDKWVMGVAHNVDREQARARRTRDACTSSIEDAEGLGSELSPEEQAHYRYLAEKLARAIQELPLDLFEVLWLVAIEERSHEEAARLLGISEAASKKRLERARGFLRERMRITQDDLHAALPLVWLVGDERASWLQRCRTLARRLWRLRPGRGAVTVVLFGLFPWPSPAPALARTGLGVREPVALVAEETRHDTEDAVRGPGAALVPNAAALLPARPALPVDAAQRRTQPVPSPTAPVIDTTGLTLMRRGNR